MPKNYRKGDKEFDLENRLKHENKKLKRELKAARKLLDRYRMAEEKGLIDEGAIVPSKKRNKEKELQEQWACFTCGQGVLRLKRILTGTPQERYYRLCDGCGKQTKVQLWHEGVEGIE